jgi:hypothetical protein
LDAFDYFHQYVHIHIYIKYHYEGTMIQYQQIQMHHVVVMMMLVLGNNKLRNKLMKYSLTIIIIITIK